MKFADFMRHAPCDIRFSFLIGYLIVEVLYTSNLLDVLKFLQIIANSVHVFHIVHV